MALCQPEPPWSLQTPYLWCRYSFAQLCQCAIEPRQSVKNFCLSLLELSELRIASNCLNGACHLELQRPQNSLLNNCFVLAPNNNLFGASALFNLIKLVNTRSYSWNGAICTLILKLSLHESQSFLNQSGCCGLCAQHFGIWILNSILNLLNVLTWVHDCLE